jgi:hypothetical protein
MIRYVRVRENGAASGWHLASSDAWLLAIPLRSVFSDQFVPVRRDFPVIHRVAAIDIHGRNNDLITSRALGRDREQPDGVDTRGCSASICG